MVLKKTKQLLTAVNKRYAILIEALNETGPRAIVSSVDIVFGSYNALMVILSSIAYLRGEGQLRTIIVMSSFFLINFVISRISVATSKTVLVESIRVIFGTIIAPTAYILSASPFEMWWQGFFIMSTGASFLLTLLTGKAFWGRVAVLYYAALLILCMLFTRGSMLDIYMTLNYAGTVIMIGLIMTEMVSLLGALLIMKVVGLQHEIKMAAEIQLGMLPKKLPTIPGYEISAKLKMTRHAGGDLYDVFQISNNEFLLAIGDVSGKGMSAALYMSAALNVLRTEVVCLANNLVEKELSPGDLLKMLNTMMKNTMRPGNFITVFVGILNTDTHELRYTCGGHDPCVLWNAQTERNEFLTTKGQACGIISPTLFNPYVEEKRVYIQPGDYLIWNTDGITEAKNKNAVEYTDKQYWAKIQQLAWVENPEQVLENIIKDVETFVDKAEQYDDMALLCLKRRF